MICVFKCPYCGNEMKYDEVTHQLKCISCESTLRMEDYDYTNMIFDNRKNISADYNGFSCPNCGSEVIVNKIEANVTCPYCTSSMVVFGLNENEMEPEYVIPFKIDKEGAKRKLISWWSSMETMPKFDEEKLKLTYSDAYIPVWLHGCDLHINMEAKVAPYEMSVKEVKRASDIFILDKTVDSTFVNVPIVASARTNSKIFHEIEPYNYEEIKVFNHVYLSGHKAERYYLSVEDSVPRMQTQMHKYGVEQCKLSIEADKFGGPIINSKIKELQIVPDNVNYALVPVWICNYEYKGKKYQIFINGQTGKTYGESMLAGSKFYLTSALFYLVSMAATLPFMAITFDLIYRRKMFGTELYFVLLSPILMFVFLGMVTNDYYHSNDNIEYTNYKVKLNINESVQRKYGGKFSITGMVIARILISALLLAFWFGIIIPVLKEYNLKTAADLMTVLSAAAISALDTFIMIKKKIKFLTDHDTVDYFEYIKAGRSVESPAKLIKTNY